MTLRSRRPALVLVLAAGLALAAPACGSSGGGSSSGASATAATGAAGVRVVSPKEANALIAAHRPTIIDVRTQAEYDAGHLNGARLYDIAGADFRKQIEALDRSMPYVVYCHSGNRSGQARELMASLGFTDVADVDGGITAWEAAGLPVTR